MYHTISRFNLTLGLSLEHATGIEIGPLVNPVVRRDQSNVKYVDRASTAELREWYSRDEKINVDDIMDIDYIWGEQSLAEATKGTEQFDYCIASHVIEHIPDLISWLGEISSVLREGGRACFAVPDRRYTFDYLRDETNAADLIDNYLNKRRKPSIRHIFDHFSKHADLCTEQAWAPDFDGSQLKPGKSARDTFQACLDAQQGDKYVDSHCSVFTEQSFFELLSTISELGLLDFKVSTFFPVRRGMFEFFVHLEKIDSTLTAEEKHEVFKSSLEAINNTYLKIGFASSIACAPKLYVDVGRGFNEIEAIEMSYAGSNQNSILRFQLPQVEELKLRFDPMDSEAEFSIHDIEYSFLGDAKAIPLTGLEPLSDIENVEIKDGVLHGQTVKQATDPAFMITI